MSSVSEIIVRLRSLAALDQSLISEVSVNYFAPTLHVDVVSDHFSDMGDETRFWQLQKWLENDGDETPLNLSDVMARLPVVVSPLSNSEYIDKLRWVGESGGSSWVSSFLKNGGGQKSQLVTEEKFVHFYGYKGGQGRSTVLGLLAKALADDGYKVLVVDADIEAPSMDMVFGISADSYDQTLMGLCGWSSKCRPIAGGYSGRADGRIDILPCRPRQEGADLDFALLAATAPLDTRIYERAAEKLRLSLPTGEEKYDVVLIDHRTGIASSVLPIMSKLPGAAVVFARSDSNLSTVPSDMLNVVRAIFSNLSSESTAAFVSFSLDPNKTGGSKSEHDARIQEVLLTALAESIEFSNEDSMQVSPSELILNWVDWYLDRALLEPTLPDVSRLQSDNQNSLIRLREVLLLPVSRKREVPQIGNLDKIAATGTSVSGAKDMGAFIHISGVEKMFVPGNPYTYIWGRKGTGKTRLLRELSARNLGNPLLVAADEESTTGLQSQSVEVNDWLEKCEFDANVFWWSLIRVAIEREEGESLAQALSKKIIEGSSPRDLAHKIDIKSKLMGSETTFVFLIDGLETLVAATRIKSFVSSLFELMGGIQNDSGLAGRLVIRAFVREDLASDTIQNIEQQVEGRSLQLKWSAQAILNFAVSRVPTLKWMRENFRDVCEDIAKRWSEVQRGELSEQEATEILLEIFPSRLRRNNLSTATFLRLYFSDAGGDDTNKATFYPRLYLSFLNKLNLLASNAKAPIDVDGRLDSTLLNQAYDEASGEFINETKQELSYLLSLDYENGEFDEEDARERVTKFVASFEGMRTPFQHQSIVSELKERTGFTERSVRESLQRMKAVRMFEERPGYVGWWRVGQLYKRGLKMKYVR